MLKGSFDAYAEAGKRKKGTTEVDDAFLEEIERWRELLAKNIAERNPQLTQYDLNFAVQRTIDRITFLRICEDRGVEDYGRLQKLIGLPNTYKGLLERFIARTSATTPACFISAMSGAARKRTTSSRPTSRSMTAAPRYSKKETCTTRRVRTSFRFFPPTSSATFMNGS